MKRQASLMKLIVGLGNPGRGYANNRHNVGFVCLNYFARTQGIRFDKKQGKARIGIGEVAGSKVVVALVDTKELILLSPP